MAPLIQAVRGMKDILPTETPYWLFVEKTCQRIAKQYGYQEIRFPVLEATQLFKRTIGESTDIVEKEMYTFEDRNGDSLTLRPEGTAGCVRAGIQHGLFYHQMPRLWYLGPMFRHERPQQGRYRQFFQFGVEIYGVRQPAIDAELIVLSARLWKKLGIEGLTLCINTLGSPDSRARYRDQLLDYLKQHRDSLDEDSQRRLTTNPLRILDSKNPQMKGLISNAPRLLDVLDKESREYFEQVKQYLDQLGVAYQVQPALVRGLDYYDHTVFEWMTEELGAQGSVCAGGRYDRLVEQLGGESTPAMGFAVGLDRVVQLLKQKKACQQQPDVYVLNAGDDWVQALQVSETLRDAMPTLSLELDCRGGNLKNQFKRADKSQAAWALVVPQEAHAPLVLKDLRETLPQWAGELNQLIHVLQQKLKERIHPC